MKKIIQKSIAGLILLSVILVAINSVWQPNPPLPMEKTTPSVTHPASAAETAIQMKMN